MPEREEAATPPTLALLAAAALFSTGGAAIKLSALDAWQVVCLRSAIAAVTLLLLLADARRAWRPVAAVAAVPYAATMVLFVLATKLTTAANAILLQSTAPLYLTLMAPRLLGEPTRRRDLVALGCMLVGLALVASDARPGTATAPAPVAGNAAGAAAGLAWACTVIGFRRAVAARGGALPGPTFVAGNVLAALATLPAALPLPPLAAREALVLAWLGIVQISLGYVCLGLGVRHASAMATAMLLLLEPVLNPLWVWLLHGEAPGMRAAAGGVVILAATAVQVLVGRGAAARSAPDRAMPAPPC